MGGDLGTGWLAGCGSFLLLLEPSPCFLTLQVSGMLGSFFFEDPLCSFWRMLLLSQKDKNVHRVFLPPSFSPISSNSV